MTQVKHTQGPWLLSENTNDTQDAPFTEFCIEGSNGEIVGIFTNEANARLIAAAPELLDALLDMVYSNEIQLEDHDEDSYIGRSFKKARAAIAKATGES